MRRLSRRGLISAAVAVPGAHIARHVPMFGSSGRFDPLRLVALCSNVKCSAMIGMACLRALPPAEASRDTLLSRIAELASEAGGLANSAQFRRSLRAKSRRDFRIGAVLTVDGWILSITEARVYALTALLKAETDSVSGEGPPPMAAAS